MEILLSCKPIIFFLDYPIAVDTSYDRRVRAGDIVVIRARSVFPNRPFASHDLAGCDYQHGTCFVIEKDTTIRESGTTASTKGNDYDL